MAQLKDLLVTGASRLIGDAFTNKLQVTSLQAPTASNGTTYGAGSNGQVLKTNGTSVYWASIGGASGYGVTDSTSASAIGTSTSLPTERDIYYGLPTINNAHNYTSSTTIYAPTAGGTADTQALVGNGATTAPKWVNISPSISITAGDGSNAPKINVTVLGRSGTAQAITTASTSVYGVTKLYNGVDSTSTALAATANAVKTAYDKANGIVAAADAMVFKGVLNGASSTTYTPAADCGHTYKVNTAGLINGEQVETGDILICTTDSTAAATSSNVSTVKANWVIVQNNIDGAVYRGANTFTDANIIIADNTAGKVKSSGKTITATAPSSSAADTTIPTSKAVWSAISGASGYGKTGTVTKVSTGVGLTGGDITGEGTIKAKLKTETAFTADSAAQTNTANRQYMVGIDKSGYLSVNVPWTDANTWRGIQDNLTSDSATDSLSAKQGKALANGSARDNTKLPLAGGTMTGAIKRYYDAASTDPVLSITSNDKDVTLFNIGHGTAAGTPSSCWYRLVYKGTGSSPNNTLQLIAAKSTTESTAVEINEDGMITFNGTGIFKKTTDAAGTANNSPALIVGGTATQAHIEIDSNEIMAKGNGTTTATLYLNHDGGEVQIGDKVAARVTSAPTSGQVMIADGTGGLIKSSGYTIATSVPSGAKFTDTTYTANNGVSLSGTTFSNSGVRATTINGNYLRVNTNGTNADLTIPYATNSGTASKLGSSTVGSSVLPIYLNSGIPTAISSIQDETISWGGPNLAGSTGVVDTLLNNQLRPNRFSGFKPAGTTIEYSTDGGSSWTNYGASDAQKLALFTTSVGLRLVPSGNVTNNSQLRITMDTMTGGCYTQINKIMIYISTSYSNGCKVTIDASLGNDPTNFSLKICENQAISGWSGWNVINKTFTTYGNTSSAGYQYGKIRFTFKHDSITSGYEANGLTVYSIYGYGGVGWNVQNNLARSDHAYTYDQNLNVTFPGTVSATGFSGNASTATKTGVASMWTYSENNNELNFGGTNNSSTIYLGYRAKDSKPIPTKFVFGSSTGTADLQTKTVYLGSGTSSYISSTNYTGNAATATKATQDESGNNIKASYASSFSISDHTITLKNKKGESLGTVTVPDNNTWNALSTSQAGYVAQAPNDTTKFLRGDAKWAVPPYPVTSVAGKTGAVTLSTLTVGSKTYNGSSNVTIEIADLDLASTTTFLGITSTNLSNGSTTSPVTIVIGPTTGNVSPSNGSVVMEQSSGEEYIWTGNKWNLMGLASSWALANHIHGNILNNGTITSDTVVASNQHLVITDSNNKISRSALTFGTSTTTYLTNKGTWATPSGDHKVTQNDAITTNAAYPVILANSTATTAVTNTVNKASTLTYNPSTTKLHTPIVEVTSASFGGTLPSTGTTGQIFFQTGAEYYELPTGGTTGQVLAKSSNADRAVQWVNPPSVSPSSAKFYPAGSTTTTTNSNAQVFNTAIYVQNNVLFGAAWNDYAEYREVLNNINIQPGKCVVENGDDTIRVSINRMEPGASIVSDTYGFAIGKTETANLPIAVSGRVLAYPYENREEFKKNIGKPVCSGPNGTVSIMTDEEYRNYGYCAIGTISSVPNYEIWGENNIKVDNRVWIKVR